MVSDLTSFLAGLLALPSKPEVHVLIGNHDMLHQSDRKSTACRRLHWNIGALELHIHEQIKLLWISDASGSQHGQAQKCSCCRIITIKTRSFTTSSTSCPQWWSIVIAIIILVFITIVIIIIILIMRGKAVTGSEQFTCYFYCKRPAGMLQVDSNSEQLASSHSLEDGIIEARPKSLVRSRPRMDAAECQEECHCNHNARDYRHATA